MFFPQVLDVKCYFQTIQIIARVHFIARLYQIYIQTFDISSNLIVFLFAFFSFFFLFFMQIIWIVVDFDLGICQIRTQLSM